MFHLMNAMQTNFGFLFGINIIVVPVTGCPLTEDLKKISDTQHFLKAKDGYGSAYVSIAGEIALALRSIESSQHVISG